MIGGHHSPHGRPSLKQVKQITIAGKMSVNELIAEMGQTGVMGSGRLGKAVDILETMRKDKDCTIFFGFAGAMVPGGMKNIIIDMLKHHVVDVLVTTGASLTHDFAEALGHAHYQGRADADDAALNKQHLDRMYDSYMPNEVYGGMEDFLHMHYDLLFGEEINITEFLRRLGSIMPTDHPSIIRACYEEKIPLFCPALADSGIGLMIWGQLAKGKKVKILAFDDLREILDIAWECKKAGVFYIGGGVPKNYIQQAMQFSPKAAEYGVQVTTDRPEYGGSSGAELREGVSWGKMNPSGNYVDVSCDATIALPLIYAALKERLRLK
ncbi:deoxyhypusine synthase family protein [Candidatus Woesearchaeota archaeon]|nr:deoxyhypusine synthase family protein [Candidatus Woesearchaeota archaeon]